MPDRDDRIIAELAEAGIGPEVTRAAFAIDAVLQSWRRRVQKRELGQRALAELELDLDLAQLDVLMAIAAPSNEFQAEDGEETMVSTIATRLGIDPSRASRVVADLIGKGLALRAVSQRDARRTVVELTDRGAALVHAVRSYKFIVMGEFLQGWTPDEIATFLPLLDRFTAWSNGAPGPRSAALTKRIEALAEELRADAV